MTNTLDLISEEEIALMIEDTSKLVARNNAENLSNSISAAYASNALTNEVEFWKWMKAQRDNIKNIFNKYDAGTVSNQPSIDVVRTNFLTGETQEYQLKAYTKKTNPDLKNTSKNTTISLVVAL